MAATTVIDTERLSLRHMAADDAPFILDLLNDEAFHRYIGDRGVRTLEAATTYITSGPMAMYERLGFGLYLVVERATGKPTGICGVLKRDALEEADLGFAFMPAYRGKGYAHESAAAVTAYAGATLGMRRLLAVVQPDNARSLHLLGRLGFVDEGTVRLSADGPELLLLAATLNEAQD